MSLTVKKALVHTALVLLTLWPGVHIWLAKTYGLSSWKLGGWGMYATPRPKVVGMEIYFRRRGASEFDHVRQPTGPVGDAARRFLDHYRWLGRLALPQRFARSMLEMNPGWEQVKVLVYQPALERDTGMMVMRKEVFEESAR